MAYITDYCSSSDLKSYLRINDSQDDAQIALAVTAASRAIDHHCGRSFGVEASAVARYYEGQWNSELCRYTVSINDLMTTDSLTVKTDDGTDTFPTSLTLNTDFRLAPYNAAADGRPWTYLVATSGTVFPRRPRAVEVTAKFGWTAVPTEVKNAALLQASRIFARRNSPYGVAGSPEGGNEIRLLNKVDPDVAVLLSGVRRYWGAV